MEVQMSFNIRHTTWQLQPKVVSLNALSIVWWKRGSFVNYLQCYRGQNSNKETKTDFLSLLSLYKETVESQAIKYSIYYLLSQQIFFVSHTIVSSIKSQVTSSRGRAYYQTNIVHTTQIRTHLLSLWIHFIQNDTETPRKQMSQRGLL